MSDRTRCFQESGTSGIPACARQAYGEAETAFNARRYR